jgi:PiT family inorganic phosphate transporter
MLLVIAFEATNGFHDAANAVATVIYTQSLKPGQAVVWSGLMNFLGVIIGGISVAYALVELLPAEVLSPPSGAPAVGMLVALFVSALFWNIGTWWFGLPNSSSHCLIGALIGVAIGNAMVRDQSFRDAVQWAQVRNVLEALAVSPVLGCILSAVLYFAIRKLAHDRNLYEPLTGDARPVWWMRGILIFTCTGVSLAHGTNDGQKSIGLIMLTIIGVLPAFYALNPAATQSLGSLPGAAQRAAELIQRYGNGEKGRALDAASRLQSARLPSSGQASSEMLMPAALSSGRELALRSDVARRRSSLRDDVYRLIWQLRYVEGAGAISEQDKKSVEGLRKQLGAVVEYAPWWVRILSALCLGTGTMVGYRRIVTTLGQRLGNVHLTPAQGASAELVSSILIGISGFTGLPVSTTHIVTSGIAGIDGLLRRGPSLRYVVAHCHRLACDAPSHHRHRGRALLFSRKAAVVKRQAR